MLKLLLFFLYHICCEYMEKEAWSGTGVWSLAMRAVKLHMETAA